MCLDGSGMPTSKPSDALYFCDMAATTWSKRLLA